MVPVNKSNNKYYHCTDSDRFLEIEKNKIYDHTPHGRFRIQNNRIKNNSKTIIFYTDKKETFYYSVKLIDKDNEVILFQINNNEPTFFINEKK